MPCFEMSSNVSVITPVRTSLKSFGPQYQRAGPKRPSRTKFHGYPSHICGKRVQRTIVELKRILYEAILCSPFAMDPCRPMTRTQVKSSARPAYQCQL